MHTANQPSATPRKTPGILVVEDNDVFRMVLTAALEQYLPGCNIAEAVSVKDALRVLGSRRIDVMVVDMTLPDGTAITLLDRSQEWVRTGLKTVVMSNHASEDMLPLMDREDVHSYVEKALGPRQLALAIQTAIAPASIPSTEV